MQMVFGLLLPSEMAERSPESQQLQITSIFNPWYHLRIVQHISHNGDETFFGCSLIVTPGGYRNVSFDVNFILTVFEDVFYMGETKEAVEGSCFYSHLHASVQLFPKRHFFRSKKNPQGVKVWKHLNSKRGDLGSEMW